MSKTRLSMGRISYINASPVYYGLDNGLLPDWIEMTDGAPSVLNQMIKNRELEISPVSAAFYGMNHKDLLILPDLSISCYGKVLSVIQGVSIPPRTTDGMANIDNRLKPIAAALMKMKE